MFVNLLMTLLNSNPFSEGMNIIYHITKLAFEARAVSEGRVGGGSGNAEL